jgi:hypothetical protein
VRDAIERVDCIVDAILMKRRECPESRSDLLSWCLSALPRFYPQLVPLIDRQFQTIPFAGACEGCTLYVHTASS